MGPKGPVGEDGPQGQQGDPGDQGNPGPKGEDGEEGDPGDQGEKGTSGTDGQDGEQGPKGDTGTSVYITAELEDEAGLSEHTPPDNITEAYLIQGDLWVWDVDEEDWKNLGRIQGAKGRQGERGDEGEMGTGSSGLDIVTVTYDDGGVSAGSGVIHNEILLKGGYARRPNESVMLKYLVDFPEDISASTLYSTTNANINSVRYIFDKWVIKGDEETPDADFDFADPVTGDITLKAIWKKPDPVITFNTGASADDIITQAVNEANTNANYYYLFLKQDVANVPSQTLSTGDFTAHLTIHGVGEKRTISLKSGEANGLFRANTRACYLTLTNINLIGIADNTAPLLNNVSYLTMTNCSVKNNVNTSSGANQAGAIYVNNGTITMTDCEISGNSVTGNGSGSVAGVLVVGSGTFTMNGGTITGNTVNVTTSDSSLRAMAVLIAGTNGIFYMNGGTISGNTNTATVDTGTTWDVYISETARGNAATIESFYIGGDATIGTYDTNTQTAVGGVCLSAPSGAITVEGKAAISIASDWTGRIACVHLRSNVVATPQTNWYTNNANSRVVLRPARTHTEVTARQFQYILSMGRIVTTYLDTYVDMKDPANASAGVTITGGSYFIQTTGTNAGKLGKNS